MQYKSQTFNYIQTNYENGKDIVIISVKGGHEELISIISNDSDKETQYFGWNTAS